MIRNILGQISLLVFCAMMIFACYIFQKHGMLLLWRVGTPYWLNYLLGFLFPIVPTSLLTLTIFALKRSIKNKTLSSTSKSFFMREHTIEILISSTIMICLLFAGINFLNLTESGDRIAPSQSLVEQIGLPRAQNLVKQYNRASLTGKTMLLTSWNSSLPFVEINNDQKATLMLGSVYYPSLTTVRAPKSIVISSSKKIEWSWKSVDNREQMCLSAECFDLNPENGVLTLQGKPAFRIAQVDDTRVHWNVTQGSHPTKESTTELVVDHPLQPVTALFY